MRLVAKKSNIAIGSIYKYFNSKQQLLLTTIESIWTEIINDFLIEKNFNSFIDCIYKLFDCFIDKNQ